MQTIIQLVWRNKAAVSSVPAAPATPSPNINTLPQSLSGSTRPTYRNCYTTKQKPCVRVAVESRALLPGGAT